MLTTILVFLSIQRQPHCTYVASAVWKVLDQAGPLTLQVGTCEVLMQAATHIINGTDAASGEFSDCMLHSADHDMWQRDHA